MLLVAVGLYVRLALEETAGFRNSGPVSTKLPITEVFTTRPAAVLLGAGSTTAVFAFFYIGVTYLTSYSTQQLQLPRPSVLAMGIVGGVVFALTTIASAILSDRVGRRKMVVGGNIASVAAGLVAFPIIDIGTVWSFGLGLSLVLGVVGIAYGPIGAQLPELFPTRFRYTGAGIAYNLAGVFGGGVVPLFAAALAASTLGSLGIGLLLSAVSLLSLLCTLALPQTDADSLAEQDARLAAA